MSKSKAQPVTEANAYTAATITRALAELGRPTPAHTPAVASAIAILALERHRLLDHGPPLYECRHRLCQPYR